MLGGILAGAMKGGAQAGMEIADAELAQRRKAEMMQLEQQLAIERADAIARRQQAIAREDQTYNTTGQGGQEKLAFKKKEGEVETDAEVAKRQKLDPLDVAKAGSMQKAKNDEDTRAVTERGNNKGYLTAKQREADAGESSSLKSSRGESTRGARIENDQKAEVANLRKRAEQMRARGDEAGAVKLEDEIARRQGAKPGSEYDLEKVVEESEDPATGAKIRRERTERRKPATAAGKPPPAGAPYAEGARLIGPDGKFYIVKGGKPVLEGN